MTDATWPQKLAPKPPERGPREVASITQTVSPDPAGTLKPRGYLRISTILASSCEVLQYAVNNNRNPRSRTRGFDGHGAEILLNRRGSL